MNTKIKQAVDGYRPARGRPSLAASAGTAAFGCPRFPVNTQSQCLLFNENKIRNENVIVGSEVNTVTLCFSGPFVRSFVHSLVRSLVR